MNTGDLIRVLKETETQMLEVSGMLAVSDASSTDEEVVMARHQLISMIHGIRIIHNALEFNPEVKTEEQAYYEAY